MHRINTINNQAHSRGLHYGWLILAVSTLTVLGCIGFARFGYTMILPDMQMALDLSNTQTGALATGNFIGYLALAVVGGFIASRYGPRRVIGLSMLLTGAAIALTGLANNFPEALVWRVLAGAGSGGSNVPVMALLPAWFAARRRGFATGIAVTGASLGLMITGLLVPRTLDAFGEDGWRYTWFILGGLVVLLGLLSFALLRDRPEEKGLRPIAAGPGRERVPTLQVARASERPDEPAVPSADQAVRHTTGGFSLDWGQVYRSGAVWRLALVYTAFGVSYVIYGTFFAKYLQAEGNYTKEAAGNLWAVVGWISIFCGLIWGTVSDLIGRKYGLALVYVIQATSYAAFALWRNPAGYLTSIILFGLTAWSIPGIVAATCGDYLGARMAPAALGFVTQFFGLGQAAGPIVAGALADASGSFRPAFIMAAGVAFLGGVGSFLLRSPRAAAEE